MDLFKGRKLIMWRLNTVIWNFLRFDVVSGAFKNYWGLRWAQSIFVLNCSNFFITFGFFFIKKVRFWWLRTLSKMTVFTTDEIVISTWTIMLKLVQEWQFTGWMLNEVSQHHSEHRHLHIQTSFNSIAQFLVSILSILTNVGSTIQFTWPISNNLNFFKTFHTFISTQNNVTICLQQK